MNVYTSGVFDLFHAGHVEALNNAKAYGTTLIVGVLSDEDAASYKRKPVIPYEQRYIILNSLSVVDHVIPGPKHETPEFYKMMEINIHVQGDQLDGFYEVAQHLGILKIIGRSDRNQTSSIINTISNRLTSGTLP